MSSIFEDDDTIHWDRMNGLTQRQVENQMVLQNKMERILKSYGQRLISDPKLQPRFPEPTTMVTNDPEKEEKDKLEKDPKKALTGFTLKTYPGASPTTPAIIQGAYSLRFYEKLWELCQEEWIAVLTETNPRIIEERLTVINEIVVFKRLWETNKIIWTMKWKGNIKMINIMAGFGILIAQHPQIDANQLGISMIQFMNGRKLKNVLFDNLTALLVGDRYQYAIKEREDDDQPDQEEEYPRFDMTGNQVGIKTQHREGPIIECEIDEKFAEIQMEKYKKRKAMAQECHEMALTLIKYANINGPVPELMSDFNALAAFCCRRENELKLKNKPMREGLVTQGKVKLIVYAKTDQNRPVLSGEINQRRSLFYWIGKNTTNYSDKLNEFHKIQVEIKMNGYGPMTRLNDYGPGTIAVRRGGQIVALSSISPYSPWDGQLAARQAVTEDYYGLILQPLQRHIDETMPMIQKIKIIDEEEIWTVKVNYRIGDIEVYEPSQVILAGDKVNKDWDQIMAFHCRERGIFDHFHGDFTMDLYPNTDYEGFYISSNGPTLAVRRADARYWRERERMEELAMDLVNEQREEEKERTGARPPPSTTQYSQGPGVERRMILWRQNGPRPRPRTPPPMEQRDGRRERMRENDHQRGDNQRERSRSREERGLRIKFTTIAEFCRENGINLANSNDPPTTPEPRSGAGSNDGGEDESESSSSQHSMSPMRIEGQETNDENGGGTGSNEDLDEDDYDLDKDQD